MINQCRYLLGKLCKGIVQMDARPTDKNLKVTEISSTSMQTMPYHEPLQKQGWESELLFLPGPNVGIPKLLSNVCVVYEPDCFF